jgi:hypothetical protein
MRICFAPLVSFHSAHEREGAYLGGHGFGAMTAAELAK